MSRLSSQRLRDLEQSIGAAKIAGMPLLIRVNEDQLLDVLRQARASVERPRWRLEPLGWFMSGVGCTLFSVALWLAIAWL